MPYAGGLMEQPGAAILRMERVLQAYDEYEEFQDLKREGRRKMLEEQDAGN